MDQHASHLGVWMYRLHKATINLYHGPVFLETGRVSCDMAFQNCNSYVRIKILLRAQKFSNNGIRNVMQIQVFRG